MTSDVRTLAQLREEWSAWGPLKPTFDIMVEVVRAVMAETTLVRDGGAGRDGADALTDPPGDGCVRAAHRWWNWYMARDARDGGLHPEHVLAGFLGDREAEARKDEREKRDAEWNKALGLVDVTPESVAGESLNLGAKVRRDERVKTLREYGLLLRDQTVQLPPKYGWYRSGAGQWLLHEADRLEAEAKKGGDGG